jgi:hypothetical protein
MELSGWGCYHQSQSCSLTACPMNCSVSIDVVNKKTQVYFFSEIKIYFSVLLWSATLKQQGPLECSCPPQGLGDESPANTFRLGYVSLGLLT